MLNRKLLIAGIATLALIGGCSKKKGGEEFYLDPAKPNGIWEVSNYSRIDATVSAFSTRAIDNNSTPTAGKVIITPFGITEYYDFDTGNACDQRYTDKFSTAWTAKHETFIDSKGDIGTSTFTDNFDGTALVSLHTPSADTTLTLKYEGEYTATSELELDQETCDRAEPSTSLAPFDGFWLQTSRDTSNDKRARTILEMTNSASGIASVTLHIEYQFRDDWEQCYEKEYGTLNFANQRLGGGLEKDKETGVVVITGAAATLSEDNNALSIVTTGGRANTVTFTRVSNANPQSSYCPNDEFAVYEFED